MQGASRLDDRDEHVWKREIFAMVQSFISACSILPLRFNFLNRLRGLFAALLFVLPALAMQASVQTTTISGTVYDPRTLANGGLPVPGVLVYATTGTVAPLTPGVQCLTSASSAPIVPGIVSFTNTAVDGTFTLNNVPVNATYTVVIQAGKWRRQFTETVGTTALAGIELDMPSNHKQGDIPLIAISTGGVDGMECVLRDMGIADTEFTDDNGTVNPGGRIHLYQGSGTPQAVGGAVINASTPSETVLMSSPTTMNGYDVLMFPCQGGPDGQATPAGATNLLNYANTGGRVFATHYGYAWLDPSPPFDSQFPPVVDWNHNLEFPFPDPGAATINTGFTDGAALAQWLLNEGASNTYGQVELSTLRNDISAVIPPTQSWATVNSDSAIMQITFNAPVGAPAANQCGRVLYNEYHVVDLENLPNGNDTGQVYPSECPGSALPPGSNKMTPQEEMLEYALFDLSSFVTPVVVPTLSISFNPSPLIVNQNETGVPLTVNVTNTSTTTPINSTAVLTLTLPVGLTATGLTDATGDWNCAVGTLTCTRTVGIAAGTSDAVTLTVSVPAYPTGGIATPAKLTATVSSPNFSNNVSASDSVIFQQAPTILWATPAPIIYGTPLSGTQLDASSVLPGSFVYSPAAGTVLTVGQHTLSVTFAPTDTTDYATGTATVTLTVLPVTPSLGLTASPNPAFALNPVTLTATIAAFATPPTGTITFYDGTTQIGVGTVTAGSATCTVTTLSGGIHSITAAYSGDSSYEPATSGAVSETILDFKLAESNSVTAGAVTTYNLTITPEGGTTFPGALTMSVSGLPLRVAGVFTPATVPANSGATPVVLQVTSLNFVAMYSSRGPFGGGALPMALGLILLPFAGMLRKAAHGWNRLVLLGLIGAALAVGLTGCNRVTLTPHTYSITITAAAGPLSHSVTASLTVQ
ncbi:MAG: Ig-like domain repeat protein [Terracidiphilus sp.]